MASEAFMRRCRNGYAKLLRLFPKAHRERFGEQMEQTFNDLCRERVKAGRGIFPLALSSFTETSLAILKENATNLMRCSMKSDSITSLKIVKYSAITVGALMLAGIAALMIISRGKGEDITGIVAPALFITLVSIVVTIVTTVLQSREERKGGSQL